jgi:hypothetical protein
MKRNLVSVLRVGAIVVLAASAVLAHHSQSAEFDRNKTIEFTGTVRAVEWTNPHGYVQVEAARTDGNVSVYRVEIGAPNGLYRDGWRRDSVIPGTEVTFTGSPSRNPESTNVSGRLMMPDGTVAFRGAGPAAN